jgi:hypothetical protein
MFVEGAVCGFTGWNFAVLSRSGLFFLRQSKFLG